MRRIAIALMLAAVGCGIAFSPGDFGGTATKNVADSGTSGALPDAANPTDGATTPPLAHVVFITGDGADGGVPTSEIWTATIGADGNLGGYVYNAPNPIPGPVQAATIVDTSLLLSTLAGGSRLLESATWDGGIVPVAYVQQTANTSSPPGDGQFFAGATLVSVGGVIVTSSTDEFGNTTTSYDYDAGVWVSAPDGGKYTDAGASPTPNLADIESVSAAVYKSFVYFNGTNVNAASQASLVYVGKLDPALGVTNVQPTTAMLNPTTQHMHTPSLPMFCAGDGYLFVAGGQDPTADNEVVLYAQIDETSGKLAATWQAGPVLPAPLKQAGCFTHDGSLYLVGGRSGADGGATGALTNQILRWRFGATPPSTEWELSAGQPLPAPRSNILALIY